MRPATTCCCRTVRCRRHPCALQPRRPVRDLLPHDESEYPPRHEFSVERNFFREWVEELYAADVHERPKFTEGPDPEDEPEVLRLKDALQREAAELLYSGVSVNLLTLRPEICLLLLIKDPVWLKEGQRIAADSGRPFRLGWEYASARQEVRHRSTNQPDHWKLRIDAERLNPTSNQRLEPSFLVPNAAAAIFLAMNLLRHRLRSG